MLACYDAHRNGPLPVYGLWPAHRPIASPRLSNEPAVKNSVVQRRAVMGQFGVGRVFDVLGSAQSVALIWVDHE